MYKRANVNTADREMGFGSIDGEEDGKHSGGGSVKISIILATLSDFYSGPIYLLTDFTWLLI